MKNRNQNAAVRSLLAAASCLILTACPTTPPPDAPLYDTQWQLVQIGSADLPPDELAAANIVFSENGRKVSGSDGCNRFFGAYSHDAEAISFGMMGSTRMTCPDKKAFDQSFYNGLTISTQYRIEGDELELSNKNGVTLRFRAQVKTE